MSSNQVGRRVRVRKDKRSGVVVSQDGNRFEVAFPDGPTQYRDWFPTEELEFLPDQSASEIKKAFEEKFTSEVEKTSGGMTSGSEQKVGRVTKKPNKKD